MEWMAFTKDQYGSIDAIVKVAATLGYFEWRKNFTWSARACRLELALVPPRKCRPQGAAEWRKLIARTSPDRSLVIC